MNTFKNTITKNIIIIIILYIIPVFLIISNIISFRYRFIILGIVGLLTILSAFLKKTTWNEIGCRRNNLIPAIKNIIPITAICTVLSILYYHFYGARIDNSGIPVYFYVFYMLVSAPLQEFLYRSYIFYILSEINLSRYFLIISPVLYALAHLIYNDILTVILSLIIGIYWAYHYRQFKNLYSIAFSHIVLGIVAIATGIL
jgi:membrane protease YdiL (CAAX protease family)